MNDADGLDRGARDLIATGREGALPNAFTVERVRHAVSRTLQGAAPPARSRRRVVPLIAALGSVALGGALYAMELVRHSEAEPPTQQAAPVEEPRAPQASRPKSSPEPIAEAAAEPPEPPATEAPAAARAPNNDRSSAPSTRSQKLTAEIELLSRVNAAVNAGQGGRALELLAQYDREFRPAILGEERAAASVLALCAAGRTSEARAAAKRFRSRWQRSPLAGRVSKSCAGTE